MAAQSNTNDTAAKVMPDERTSIVASTKMYMRILRAQLLFLYETNAVPEEIEGLLSELMTTFPSRLTAVTQPQTEPPKPTHETLNPPLKTSVKEGYLQGNHRHIVASSNDKVVVFARTNDQAEAIVYNQRNKTTGRIPANLLYKDGTEPFAETRLYMTTSDEKSDTLGHVKWTAGDYVRVWNRENKPHSRCDGFCFNIATGEIGKFNTAASSLTLIN